MANPGIAVLFHLLYFLAGVRKDIAAYGKVARKIIRNSVQEALRTFAQNYQQVHVARWAKEPKSPTFWNSGRVRFSLRA